MKPLNLKLDGFHAHVVEVLLNNIHFCPEDRLLDVAFEVKRELKRISNAEAQIKYIKRPDPKPCNVIRLPRGRRGLGSPDGGNVA